MEDNKETEQCKPQQTIKEELGSYDEKHSLFVANRDGDLYYVECPECSGTDLTQFRLLGCKRCHTRFSVYFEDGFKSFEVQADGNISSYDKLKLVQPDPQDSSYFIWHGRNADRIEELKSHYPMAKVITLLKDYKNGKDGHGHEEYSKYVLIPIK